jgi:hypothetical protein
VKPITHKKPVKTTNRYSIQIPISDLGKGMVFAILSIKYILHQILSGLLVTINI